MNTHTLVGGQVLTNVHSQGRCAGEHCCIHNPSAHHMAEWTQNFRQDRGMMERVCGHGIGHPDPDDPTTDTTHGCDGCCHPYALPFTPPTPILDAFEPVGYDGFGAPLYAHQVAPEGTE